VSFRRRNDRNHVRFIQQIAPIGIKVAAVFFRYLPRGFFARVANAGKFGFAFSGQRGVIAGVMAPKAAHTDDRSP
jgi:Na+/H+-dicarboxylate symporter